MTESENIEKPKTSGEVLKEDDTNQLSSKLKRRGDTIIIRSKVKKALAIMWIQNHIKGMVVNGKDIREYFSPHYLSIALRPLTVTGGEANFRIHTKGGGISGKAKACSICIARWLSSLNNEWQKSIALYDLDKSDTRRVAPKNWGRPKNRKQKQSGKR